MSKVSDGRSVRVGLVGPKARPKGVVDGQQVNIPVPRKVCLSNGGTQKGRSDSCWNSCSKPVGVDAGVKRPAELRGDGEPAMGKAIDPWLPRKSSSETCATVPQTDTGGQVENTKGNGITFVKELGKMIP